MIRSSGSPPANRKTKPPACDACKARRVLCHPQPHGLPCPRCAEKGLMCVTRGFFRVISFVNSHDQLYDKPRPSRTPASQSAPHPAGHLIEPRFPSGATPRTKQYPLVLQLPRRRPAQFRAILLLGHIHGARKTPIRMWAHPRAAHLAANQSQLSRTRTSITATPCCGIVISKIRSPRRAGSSVSSTLKRGYWHTVPVRCPR